MISSKWFGAVLCLLMSSSLAWANFTKLDDFQRTPGTDMGADWSENQLDFSIAALSPGVDVAQGDTYADMTFVGDLQGLSPTEDWFSVMALINDNNAVPQYAGLVLRQADSANSVFVKVQDNNGDGSFDYLFFYRGTSPAQPWAGISGGSFAQALNLPANGSQVGIRARLETDTINAGMLQVVVEIDGNHNGIWGEADDDQFVRGNIDPAGLGTDVGLAGTGGAQMDDFGGYVYIPEPATLALMILGGGLLARGRKTRHG